MIFGNNHNRGYSGAYSKEAIEHGITECLTPSMSRARSQNLEALVVMQSSGAFKVLPVYGLDSLFTPQTLEVYESIKGAFKVDIHIVCRLDTLQFVDAVVPFEQLFELYAPQREGEHDVPVCA